MRKGVGMGASIYQLLHKRQHGWDEVHDEFAGMIGVGGRAGKVSKMRGRVTFVSASTLHFFLYWGMEGYAWSNDAGIGLFCQ